MTGPDADITQLLGAWSAGDPGALARLMPLLYDELRRAADHHLRRERPGHTLQPTALVNEVYVRLAQLRRMTWHGRAHFLSMCARLMRQILVDAARARRFAKRGGDAVRVTFDEGLVGSDLRGPDIVALDDALAALEALDPRKSRVVELRFFAGLSGDETAAVLGVSTDTVARDWKFAKSWLYRELRHGRSAER